MNRKHKRPRIQWTRVAAAHMASRPYVAAYVDRSGDIHRCRVSVLGDDATERTIAVGLSVFPLFCIADAHGKVVLQSRLMPAKTYELVMACLQKVVHALPERPQ